MKATDIVNVEMTALDACKLRDLMSGVGGGELSSFYGRLEGLFPSYSSLRGSYSWRNSSNFGKWALSQFEPEKTEHQIKIEKLRNTIDDAKAQIEALEG